MGLYVSVSVAIANQCVPAEEEDVLSTGTTPVPDGGAVDGGTGGTPAASPAPPSSSKKNKKQSKPAVK